MKLVDLDLCQLEAVSGGRTSVRVSGRARNSGNFVSTEGGYKNATITIGDYFDRSLDQRDSFNVNF